ncbi:MAG: amino acid decarboxylase [Acidobacteria bacterium]|nr:amino acid decarboxylase [Acidobacteriota bacterium]
MENAKEPGALGDMSAEEFRQYGYQVVDWIADYLAHPERHAVLSQVEPGYLKNALPQSAPVNGEAMDKVLADVDEKIVPGVTHWNHPAFFAYFSISASAPGILGEMFAAAFNVNAMLWRTSPAATELEEVTLNWLRQMLELPESFGGVIYDTASISSLCAIAAAREAVPHLHVREKGLYGAAAKLRLYCSEQAHSSIDKAAIVLGLGQQGIRKIACDAEFRLKPELLDAAIAEDRANGWIPFCVVATTGTTSTTSVDPVAAIADICERENLWLHVDAAYGGAAAILPEMRQLFLGCERADSLVMNPHKWMFVPVDLSVLFCRRMEVLRQAFSLVPEYLRSSETDEVKNFMEYGPQLGRRFRAIKLWFVMRYFGVEGITARLRQHLELARQFAAWVDASAEFERLAPTPFSTVCFRAFPATLRQRQDWSEAEREAALETLNEQIMERVNQRGKVFLSHTKLNGTFTIRLAIGNLRTATAHIQLAWDELNAVLKEWQSAS